MRSLRFLLSLATVRGVLLLLAVACLFLTPQPAHCANDASTHDMTEMHDGMSMPAASPVDAVSQAALLAYKRESEFNHHLAGLLVLVAGLLILADGTIGRRWPIARHVWPICFLVSGIFLLVFSDTELWPFNSQSWYFGLTHHMEVLQHKVFAVLLLGLGVIELRRARGTLNGNWSGWVFPLVAATGSLMLLFHEHQAGMTGPNHMELMHRIQSEHVSFAVTGFGIALSKGLAETSFDWRPFFQRLFPALLIVLGALLLVYVE
jgi:putative copper resistance protein D